MVDESTPPADDWTAQLVRRLGERGAARRGPGVRVVVLRSAPLLDPEGGLLKQLLLPFKLGVGGPLAGGDQYMPWIHRDDEVGLILWALDDDAVAGPLNACAPNPVTNREFSKALGTALAGPRSCRRRGFAVVAHARRGAHRARSPPACAWSRAGRSTSATGSASRSSSRRCATCCGD